MNSFEQEEQLLMDKESKNLIQCPCCHTAKLFADDYGWAGDEDRGYAVECRCRRLSGYKMSPSEAVHCWNELMKENSPATEVKTMHFVVDEKDADIGVYNISLQNEEGKTVPGTEVTLWDYSNEYQLAHRKNAMLSNRERSWKQRWTWCDGWSHTEVHTWKENLSTEQVIAEIQQWISDQLINRYNNAQENVCKLKPIIEFLQADKTRRELTGT